MKPARRVSSEGSRLNRYVKYLEETPLLRAPKQLIFESNSVEVKIEDPGKHRSSHPPKYQSSFSSSDDASLLLPSKVKFTPQQRWILLCLCLVDFSAFASMSIIAPFFPYEVSQRGQGTYVAGLIFSVYSVTVVIASAIFGRLCPYIGPRLMLILGVFVSGTANIVFGLLDYLDDDTTFITLCFVVRIIEALGAASFNTASLIYIFDIFPDHIGYAFGMTETFTTLGNTFGPALGGVLYSWLGYGLPFYVLGTFAFLTLPLICLKVPKLNSKCRIQVDLFTPSTHQHAVYSFSLLWSSNAEFAFKLL